MKEYSITIPDGMDTTVLLSDEDAKRAGLLSDSGTKAGPADPDKQPEPEASAKAAAAAAKAEAAANKAATPENKGS